MVSKKAVYKAHGIEFKAGKILSIIGWIPELLKTGNTKTGEEVMTFSLLPGTCDYTETVNGQEITERGTCKCICKGCYAMTGFFKMHNVVRSLLINTYLVNNDIEFVYHAIAAQLEYSQCKELRIHASGDFNTKHPDDYSNMWHNIALQFHTVLMWTYTKIEKYESLFDDVPNANIVKSIIPHIGLNFGHIDYILYAYETLKKAGKKVYICKCGIDENQHCAGCKICSTYDYVLFVEHSTEYDAFSDPLFPELVKVVNAQ